MKNVLLVVNAVLAVAVVVLFVLVLGGRSQQQVADAVSENDTICTGTLPVAYINIDSLLLNYQFAKDANEVLIKKEEDSRLTFNTKARKLQEEVADFQKKLDNNAFLSRERAEREQTRLMEKQQELQQLDAKLTEDLLSQQQKVSEQLRDSINNFLAEYNKDRKYQVIFSNTAGDNILQADPKYDITPVVLDALNKRCMKK